jgi:uncharacterized protein YbbC (DUF1343 family)
MNYPQSKKNLRASEPHGHPEGYRNGILSKEIYLFKGVVRPGTSIIFWIILFNLVTQSSYILAQETKQPVIVGAERTEVYFPLLQNKRLGVVANQTSLIGQIHLVDSLVHAGFNVVKAFGPEHGFRGGAGAGEEITSNIDAKTGIPVISLYGKNKKPTAEDLAGIDLMIFDIQDVGVRFYTYISTMTYVMEACAENNIPLMVLDRPNPHCDYLDGPILDPAFSSFVGLHSVPVVYGMTIGEYALMVNGEHWLKDSVQCNLKVIHLENYDHNSHYELPVPPSPNLPNYTAIQLYPSLCFFEGTIISVGRGTDYPFQVIGHPDFLVGSFDFVPRDIPGKAMDPPYEGIRCYGHSLVGYAENVQGTLRKLNLFYLLEMYKVLGKRKDYFNSFFDKLAGSDKLRNQILSGMTEDEIRQSWQKDLSEFEKIRKKYLLYPDFK